MANLATIAELAAWLQVTPDRLSKMRRNGTGPRYIKVGRAVRYAWADVHRWCDANRTAGGAGE